MYRFLEHTADVIIEVKGKDLKEIFREAARAISDFMVFIDRIDPKERKEIYVEGESIEDLLVNFLTELLALLDSELFIWKDVEINEFGEKGGKYFLKAVAIGEEYSQEKHGYKGYIKAITYHRMELKRENEGYLLRFVIDI